MATRTPTMRELYKSGVFDISPKESLTRSGRCVKVPSRYRDEYFVAGSGCCVVPHKDATDMVFNGVK